MPLHDWSRVESGIFHDFHTAWITEIRNSLNGGVLPNGFYALAEQHAGNYVADVLALHRPPTEQELSSRQVFEPEESGGAIVAEAPPSMLTRETIEVDLERLQRRLSIRHISTHRIVALIEIVSHENKDDRNRLDRFVVKTVDAIESGISVLVVDLFRPGVFDPHGMHYALKSCLSSHQEHLLPQTPPRSTLATYCLTVPRQIDMFVKHLEADLPLPEMPIYLSPKHFVNVPLEPTYERAWKGMPAFWRDVVEGKPIN